MRLSIVLCLALALVSANATKGRISITATRVSSLTVKRQQPSRKAEEMKGVLALRGGAVGLAAATTNRVPLYAIKMLLQLSLSLLNILCWIVPLRTKSFSQNATLLSVANAFAGGIFLMLGFGHLVPHSIETLDSIHANRKFAFYSTLAGFLLMLFVEKVAFNSHALLHAAVAGETPTPGVHDHGHGHNHDHGHGHGHGHSHDSVVAAATPTVPVVISDTLLAPDASAVTGHDTSIAPAAVASSSCAVVVDDSSHKAALSPTSAKVLLLAMSVHSLFETMALGIAGDTMSAVLMSVSIGLHQPAESVALLVAFLKTSMPVDSVIKWLGAFSMVGPLGVCLGLLVSKVASPFVDAILVAITAGTFLYVGATEVCNEEFEGATFRARLTRFLALAGGIAVIGGISELSDSWFGGHHHDHTHAHAH